MRRLYVRWRANDQSGSRTYDLKWAHMDASFTHTVYIREQDGLFHYAVTHPLRYNEFTDERYLENCAEIEQRAREVDPYMRHYQQRIVELDTTEPWPETDEYWWLTER